MSAKSHVVLLARVDDPVEQRTRTTRTTTVIVEHESGDALPEVIEMAIEMAPPVSEWAQY